MIRPSTTHPESILRFCVIAFLLSIVIFPLAFMLIKEVNGNLVTACLIIVGSLSALFSRKQSDSLE